MGEIAGELVDGITAGGFDGLTVGCREIVGELAGLNVDEIAESVTFVSFSLLASVEPGRAGGGKYVGLNIGLVVGYGVGWNALAFVELAIGLDVGAFVGLYVGWNTGDSVRLLDGESVELKVGLSVGEPVGLFVGELLGLFVGELLGLLDGMSLGLLDGESLSVG